MDGNELQTKEQQKVGVGLQNWVLAPEAPVIVEEPTELPKGLADLFLPEEQSKY